MKPPNFHARSLELQGNSLAYHFFTSDKRLGIYVLTGGNLLGTQIICSLATHATFSSRRRRHILKLHFADTSYHLGPFIQWKRLSVCPISGICILVFN